MSKINKEFDVIVIGGGVTGAGTARDCAMRGMKVLLVERKDIADGATGRNHGLLHSGARYAVTDIESASECIKENMILKRVAKHCVEDTNGFFISLPEDDLDYQSRFVDSCLSAGIKAEIIDPKEAINLEPSVNPDIVGVVRVPDGSVDPFRLCSSNIVDAKLHGAEILIYTEVKEIIREGDTVKGIRVIDHKSGDEKEYRAPIVVNAAGIWGHHIASLAGANVGMFPAKGALLIFAHRVNNIVLNRCRKPANADILVPGDTVCVIGTTSTKIPFEECDNMRVTPEEVNLLVSEGAKLAPALADARILRAYAGVRPLVSADNDPSGRNISRGIVLLDHETRDGIKGFITITGGKLMTYRLMAEKATDLICKKLNINQKCHTTEIPLPGSDMESQEEAAKKIWTAPSMSQKAAVSRLGNMADKLSLDNSYNNSIVCECEEVSVGEVKSALEHLDVHNLIDLRRRTRFGMGTCQGELCACRAAGLIAESGNCTEKSRKDLKGFIKERWRGVYPIAWGEALREAEYTQWVYSEVLGMSD